MTDEKIADDYGLTKLWEYLKANAYTGGDDGTFALATDADFDAVLPTGEIITKHYEYSNGSTYDYSYDADWSDKQTLRQSIAHKWEPVSQNNYICNYAHVPGNSRIFEYLVNTFENQPGWVSQLCGGCFVPYYINEWNKKIFKEENYANAVDECVKRVKALYDAHQETLNAHAALYDATTNPNPYTQEDVAYTSEVFRFLGKEGSTEDSWAYICDTNDVLFWDKNYGRDPSISKNAVYSETKAKEHAQEIMDVEKSTMRQDEIIIKKRLLYPKLIYGLEFYALFGTLDAYTAYLGGES